MDYFQLALIYMPGQISVKIYMDIDIIIVYICLVIYQCYDESLIYHVYGTMQS